MTRNLPRSFVVAIDVTAIIEFLIIIIITDHFVVVFTVATVLGGIVAIILGKARVVPFESIS